MSSRRLACFLGFLLWATAIGTPSGAQTPPAPTARVAAALETLESAIQYEVADKNLPAFSIAVVDGNQVIYAQGFGFQDAERRVPATADTIYRVGSVSKLFTDVAVMQLVESGKLDLDASVQKILPAFAPKNATETPITLRQLMSHRSGLVREPPVGHYFDPLEPSLADTVQSLNQTTLTYAPDTRTKYSNAAIAVVGAALQASTGTDYAERIEQTIFRPLGMTSSSFVLTDEVSRRLAPATMWTLEGRRFAAPQFSLGTAPAGNMYATVNDLARFIACINSDGRLPQGRLLREETIRAMTTPQNDSTGKPQSFGIGFHVNALDGQRKIGHGGAVYGCATQLEILPDHDLGVAAVAALDCANGVVERLANYALRLLLAKRAGQPCPPYPRTEQVDAGRARAIVGAYQSDDGDIAELSYLEGRLRMKRGVLHSELRALQGSGDLIVDDVISYGVKVSPQSDTCLLINDKRYERLPDEPPAPANAAWEGLIGEYGWDHDILFILEDRGRLVALIEWFYAYPLTEIGPNEFAFPDYGLYHGERLKFERDENGVASRVVAAEVPFLRRPIGSFNGKTFKIQPVRPIDELREEAARAQPPTESGEFHDSELVELVKVDPTLALDIRYATTDNFAGAIFYPQPRAFLQRPAAEALVRVQQRLRPRGLGLLVHDAYRPWSVTKMFWEATPANMRDFVANPANGSRHNRGCAVDLSLVDLASGGPIEMVSGYDEFSTRAYPGYPGGTSRERWHRDLLRTEMEKEGFAVYEFEWWHFDFKDWKKYRIGNAPLESAGAQ